MSRMRMIAPAAGGILLALLLLGGCKTHQFIVPQPIVAEYEDPFSFPAGFLMSRELRDQWFTKEATVGRVDIPVGKVVHDFAKAKLHNAFKPPRERRETAVTPQPTEGFYTIRYYDRRSEQGILIRLNSIDFQLDGSEVLCRLNMSVEDASGKTVLRRDYYGKGDPEEGRGLLQTAFDKENAIEFSTAAALDLIFDQLLDDIEQLVR